MNGEPDSTDNENIAIMSNIGQRERATQNRVVNLFQNQLDYTYYGDWQDRANNDNIEEGYLRAWLSQQGVDEATATNAIRKFKQAATIGDGKKLYYANKEVYSLLGTGLLPFAIQNKAEDSR